MDVNRKQRKVALITGAAGGIGLACAQRLHQEGYQIALHHRSELSNREQVLASLEHAKLFQFDLSLQGACDSLVKAVKNEYGRIDVLVNNAGCAIDQILPFAKPESFDQVIAVNLKPVFLLSKICSRLMIKQKSGSMINITSVVGHTGNVGQSIYSASKSGITGFTKSVSLELASYNIRCNCVAPGFIQTKMTSQLDSSVKEALLERIPMKRLGNSEEVASVVSFLASDAASYITGSTLHVNGGMFTN